MKNKTLLALLAFAVAGCGGGGGNTETISGGQAVVPAAQDAVLFTGVEAGGILGPLAVRTDPAIETPAPLYRGIVELAAHSLKAKPSTPGPWMQLSTSPALWYRIVTDTATTLQIQFSTNDSTNNAGYEDGSVTSGGNGHYPETANLSLKLILPTVTITGSGTITANDDSGENFGIKTTVSYSTGGSLSMNLEEEVVNNEVQITGSLSVSKPTSVGSITVTYTGINDNLNGFTANYTADNVHGSITVNPDGSGNATAIDSSGTWTITWNSNLNYTLTSPKGVVTTGTF